MKALLTLCILLLSFTSFAQEAVEPPVTDEQRTEEQLAEEQEAEEHFETAEKARRNARLVTSLSNVLEDVLVLVDKGSYELVGAIGGLGDAASILLENRAERYEYRGRRILEGL